MKRFFSTLLLVVYLISGIGLQINTHLCAGEISSIKIRTSNNLKSNCGCDTKEKENECCQNQQKNIKLENEQKKNETNNVSLENKKPQASPINYRAVKTSSKTNLFVREHFSPLINTSLQNLFCIYLI